MPATAAMSRDHFAWLSTESTLRPTIFTSRLSNSGFMRAMVPSSVVQTGVKSLGCENSTHHEPPSHSWKRIAPAVVSARKSGAVSPIDGAMSVSPWLYARDAVDTWPTIAGPELQSWECDHRVRSEFVFIR